MVLACRLLMVRPPRHTALPGAHYAAGRVLERHNGRGRGPTMVLAHPRDDWPLPRAGLRGDGSLSRQVCHHLASRRRAAPPLWPPLLFEAQHEVARANGRSRPAAGPRVRATRGHHAPAVHATPRGLGRDAGRQAPTYPRAARNDPFAAARRLVGLLLLRAAEATAARGRGRRWRERPNRGRLRRSQSGGSARGLRRGRQALSGGSRRVHAAPRSHATAAGRARACAAFDAAPARGDETLLRAQDPAQLDDVQTARGDDAAGRPRYPLSAWWLARQPLLSERRPSTVANRRACHFFRRRRCAVHRAVRR